MRPRPRPLPPPARRKATALNPGPAVDRRAASRVQHRVAPVLAWTWIGSIAVLIAAVAITGWVAWSRRPPLVEPRHRAEAVCFALAQPPVFDPPMRVECNAAMVPGSYPSNTTVSIALQSVMNFSDEMVVQQSRQRVGDFEVTAMWLRLPQPGGSSHWLVIGWIEDGSLAVCSFRFGGRGPVIGEEERFWGQWLMQRVLQEQNFRVGSLPSLRARVGEHQRLPSFGPPAGS